MTLARYWNCFTCSISSPFIISFTLLFPLFALTITCVFFIPYSSVISFNFYINVCSPLAVLDNITVLLANLTGCIHSPPTFIPRSSLSTVFFINAMSYNIYSSADCGHPCQFPLPISHSSKSMLSILTLAFWLMYISFIGLLSFQSSPLLLRTSSFSSLSYRMLFSQSTKPTCCNIIVYYSALWRGVAPHG